LPPEVSPSTVYAVVSWFNEAEFVYSAKRNVSVAKFNVPLINPVRNVLQEKFPVKAILGHRLSVLTRTIRILTLHTIAEAFSLCKGFFVFAIVNGKYVCLTLHVGVRLNQ
jgi:hypothetical protein